MKQNAPITFGETTIQFEVYGELIELPAKAGSSPFA